MGIWDKAVDRTGISIFLNVVEKEAAGESVAGSENLLNLAVQ